MATAERIIVELARSSGPLADAQLAEVPGLRHQAVNSGLPESGPGSGESVSFRELSRAHAAVRRAPGVQLIDGAVDVASAAKCVWKHEG